MLKTGKGYGLEVNSLVDERRDPYKSTQAAVKYLKDLYTIYGDWNLVIAAYNCGPGNVNKAIARSGGKRDYWEIYNRLPRETRGYVPAFIAANYIMNHYADHNICPAGAYGSELALDTVHVNEEMHFEQIAGVLNMPVSEIKRLNPQYKKDIIPGNKSYALVLPTEKMYAYIDQNDSIRNYNRDTYFTHRTYTDDYMNGSASLADGNTTDVYYQVKRGDNLSTIARRNGTTVARIKSWNGLTSDRLSVGKRLIVGKRAAPAQSAETQQQLAQTITDGKTTTVNTYYRVKKGDTLGEIARKNNVLVSQLRSWNNLKSTRIDINDQLIVGQKVVALPAEKEQESNQEDQHVGSNIISDYLKSQLNKTTEAEEIQIEEEIEKISDFVVDF
jgi:membrane-bound lytic murein transglycosylase D